MAVRVGMLRLGRLCGGSLGVLGTRTVLSRGWQEARLQGVRPLRYGARGREGAGQSSGRVLQRFVGGRFHSGWKARSCCTYGWLSGGGRVVTSH